MLSVKLLGGVSLLQNDQWITSELGASGRQLAGYLFEFPGTPHRREKLIELFWSCIDPESARGAMNTALWRFRKLLESTEQGAGNAIELKGNKREVVLELQSPTCVDTHRFCQHIQEGLELGQSSEITRSVTYLAKAFRGYGGPFMDGEDADWILEERERLHSLFVRAGEQLIRSYGSMGAFSEAIDVARTILQVDPFREGLQGDLMLLLVLNGQRVEALRAYERVRQSLHEELGVSPLPGTTKLADRIKSGEIFDRMDEIVQERFAAPNLTPFLN